MKTMQYVEKSHGSIGLALLPLMLPGKLRQSEIEWWGSVRAHATASSPN